MIPIVCGAAGALILILILTVPVIITLRYAAKCCPKLVSKSDDSGKLNATKSLIIVHYNANIPQAKSKTQNEPIQMKENEVYGVSIAALESERPSQESVLMSRNICYVTVQDFKS